MKEWGILTRLVLIPVMYVMKTPYHGAQTTLYCAINPSIEKDTGLYYSDCAEKLPSLFALDEENQHKLWSISEETVGVRERTEHPVKQDTGC